MVLCYGNPSYTPLNSYKKMTHYKRCYWRCEKLQPSSIAGGPAPWYKLFRKRFVSSFLWDPVIPLLGIYSEESAKHMYTRNLYRNVHSSIMRDSQRVEITRMSISCWMDEQNVAHPFNGVLFKLETDSFYTLVDLESVMLNERRQSQKYIYYKIPFI